MTDVAKLRAAVERAAAIEFSVTAGQERGLRHGYADLLRNALGGEISTSDYMKREGITRLDANLKPIPEDA